MKLEPLRLTFKDHVVMFAIIWLLVLVAFHLGFMPVPVEVSFWEANIIAIICWGGCITLQWLFDYKFKNI